MARKRDRAVWILFARPIDKTNTSMLKNNARHSTARKVNDRTINHMDEVKDDNEEVTVLRLYTVNQVKQRWRIQRWKL